MNDNQRPPGTFGGHSLPRCIQCGGDTLEEEGSRWRCTQCGKTGEIQMMSLDGLTVDPEDPHARDILMRLDHLDAMVKLAPPDVAAKVREFLATSEVEVVASPDDGKIRLSHPEEFDRALAKAERDLVAGLADEGRMDERQRRVWRLVQQFDAAPPHIRIRAHWILKDLRSLPDRAEDWTEDNVAQIEDLIEGGTDALKDGVDYAPGVLNLWERIQLGLKLSQHYAKEHGEPWPHEYRESWGMDVAAYATGCSERESERLADLLDAYDFQTTAGKIRQLRRGDYATGVHDVYARVLVGIEKYRDLSKTQRTLWLHDFKTFVQEAKLHYYGRTDVEKVHDAIRALPPIESNFLDNAKALIVQLRSGYAKGPLHLVALERQLLAYRANKTLEERASGQPGALQPSTIAALKVADTYCWTKECVKAVEAAGEILPGGSGPTIEGLGPLAAPGATGWFYFDEPIPLRTTSAEEDSGVVALLWRREGRDTGMRTWLTAFIDEPIELNGRIQTVPHPTAAWYWIDNTSLEGFEETCRDKFQQMQAAGQYGYKPASISVVMDAVMWLSRFWLASGLWLQQRVLVGSATAVPRQPGRALAREHKLKQAPLVKVITLRRAMSRGEDPFADHQPGNYTCRWVVRGHWRKQFFPSKAAYAPVWIDSYVKGPSDMPFRGGATVYAVTR